MGRVPSSNKTMVAEPHSNSGAGHHVQRKLNYTMFIPEGNYYDCNGCGERIFGYAFKVPDKPGVYCLDCKNRV